MGFFGLALQSEVDKLGEAVVKLSAELEELKKHLPPGIVSKPADAKPPRVTSGNVHHVLRQLEQRDAIVEPKGAANG